MSRRFEWLVAWSAADLWPVGPVGPNSAPVMGKIQAAECHLYGELISITAAEGRTKERYYRFTLSLQNAETGVLEWADSREIIKRGEKSLMG